MFQWITEASIFVLNIIVYLEMSLFSTTQQFPNAIICKWVQGDLFIGERSINPADYEFFKIGVL